MADTTTKTITATLGTGYPVRGEKGDTGASGFSPTATVTQTDTGATISITDASGTTTADIKNGSDGWELINTLTLSETVQNFTISVDSGGNAFKLSKVLVLFNYSSAVNGAIAVQIADWKYGYYNSHTALSGYVYVFVTLDGWCVGTGGFSSSTKLGSCDPRNITSPGPTKLSANYIQKIYSNINYGTSTGFPAGSTITVYGVRA